MNFFPILFLSFKKGLLTIPLTPLLLAFYVFAQVSVLILRVVAPFHLSLFKWPSINGIFTPFSNVNVY